jgi:hypothetical protein
MRRWLRRNRLKRFPIADHRPVGPEYHNKAAIALHSCATDTARECTGHSGVVGDGGQAGTLRVVGPFLERLLPTDWLLWIVAWGIAQAGCDLGQPIMGF